jgi:hypothetical protein
MLADIAVHDKAAFSSIVDQVKARDFGPERLPARPPGR